MKTAILAASLLIALMPVRNAIQIDQNYSDLNRTDTLSDLKTSDAFVRRYEAGEFDVPLSYPGRYEGFEVLTMTNGLSNYAETFFYVWNARGTQPKFE